ncbi:MAG: hypothetical protein ACRDRH_20795 [Pseudonocardia sp.]
MRVAIENIRALMADACRAAAVPEDDIEVVVEHYLAGELRGKSSHGVAKSCFEPRYFAHREGVPPVVREYGALAVVDARREIGPGSGVAQRRLPAGLAHRRGLRPRHGGAPGAAQLPRVVSRRDRGRRHLRRGPGPSSSRAGNQLPSTAQSGTQQHALTAHRWLRFRGGP